MKPKSWWRCIAWVCSDTGRLAEADKAFTEALTIYRDLMSSNPTKYGGRIASLTSQGLSLDIPDIWGARKIT